MKIRTAIFVVYVAVSAAGLALLMGLVLRDVRRRYIESMRRTMGDTAVLLAALATEGSRDGGAWTQKLETLPANAEWLRVFANDPADRVLFDSAGGRDVGRVYPWPMRGGGRSASENYSLPNVAEVGGELRVRAPVRRGGELVGWVGVGRPLAAVTVGVSEARWRLAMYSGVIAAVLVGAGWWIASRLTRSLERLTGYAAAVRDGRAAVPPVSKAKEIAALGRAFEEMRVSLEGKAHVERYAQALAHECKAPLTAIRGAAELLGEDLPREERARFVANLRAESDRLQRIVGRLLELSAGGGGDGGDRRYARGGGGRLRRGAGGGGGEARDAHAEMRRGAPRAWGEIFARPSGGESRAERARVQRARRGGDGGNRREGRRGMRVRRRHGAGGAGFCVGEGFRPRLLAAAARLRAEKQRAGVEHRARDCASARGRGDVGEPPGGRGAGGADVAGGVGRRVVLGRCFHREFTVASRALHAHGAAWERHAPHTPGHTSAPSARGTDRADENRPPQPRHAETPLHRGARAVAAMAAVLGERAARGTARDAGFRGERRVLSAAKVGRAAPALPAAPADGAFAAYGMVERALKHSVLVLALVFAACFLFETLAGWRLHAVHYGLVGAATGLFYPALLALGEVFKPGAAYVGAAASSSWLVTLYSAAILWSWVRAAVIGGLLAGVHGVLFVVLPIEDYALLAGTGALFAALAAAMFFTRAIDWLAQDAGGAEVAT